MVSSKSRAIIEVEIPDLRPLQAWAAYMYLFTLFFLWKSYLWSCPSSIVFKSGRDILAMLQNHTVPVLGVSVNREVIVGCFAD
jgi:hypothetical protein